MIDILRFYTIHWKQSKENMTKQGITHDSGQRRDLLMQRL